MGEWPIFINDASSLTPQAFVAQARHAVLRDKMDLVMLDHIQIMTGSMSGKDEIAKVMAISGALRQFAKDYCPVVALSQLSRQNKDQRGQRPCKQDLKGSSALEQDASVIGLVWHPTAGGKPTHEDELLIAKNREGEESVIPVLLRGALMRIEQREAA